MIGGIALTPLRHRHGKAWPCPPRIRLGDTERVQANSWIPRPSLGMMELKMALQKLLRYKDVLQLTLLRRSASKPVLGRNALTRGSFLLRVRLRRWLRWLRRTALWCRGVGDDVEIVGHGFHGGSSFC
jgi:hypothetical protein